LLPGNWEIFIICFYQIKLKNVFKINIIYNKFYLLFRWKTDLNGKHEISTKTKKKILQFVTVQRVDTGEWAIPGVINEFCTKFFLFLEVFYYGILRTCLLKV